MRFSRLRLTGFKSFVEPSDFVIERGLTGVVGPNGCGKSNLVEALRWVMGESSYKNMRASEMDDVIFSGSAARPPRNAAEVTLFLDNTQRKAPPLLNGDDEIQVSRRIERAAGSLYRINGREARAKDVQLLFADQSTGARSPSMVGQGRIGELIQAKPQARRALLEEAAGISGLHTRRHEAELRLRAAEQNLERLDDVVGELGTQIESLKRQARQAQRFKNLSADIRKAEAGLLHLRWSQAKEQATQAQAALHAATGVVVSKAAEQMEAAKLQAIGARELPSLREATAAAAAMLQKLGLSKLQLEDEARRLRERQSELIRRLEQLTSDIAREEQLRGENVSALARLTDEEASLRAEADEAQIRGSQSQVNLDEASADLITAEQALAAATAERAETSAKRNELERAVKSAQERAAKLGRQASDLDRDLDAVRAKLASAPDINAAMAALEAARANVLQAEKSLAEADASVVAARHDEAEARGPLADAKAATARLEAEAETLAQVLNAGRPDIYPPVVDRLTVDRGYEAALGAALGDDLELPTDPAAAAFWAGADMASDDPALPSGVEALARHVQAPAQLTRRLAQVGIVREEDGVQLQKQLRPGQRLVTVAGAVWRWDGYRASADAPTPAAQRLSQKNRLAELVEQLAEARAALTALEATVSSAENVLRSCLDKELAARNDLRSAQQVTSAALDALQKAERASAELSARQTALTEARSRLAEGLSEADHAVAEASRMLETAPDLTRLYEAQQAAQDRALAARRRQSDLRVAADNIRREADTRARRLETIATERRVWHERGENAERQLETLTVRRTEAEAELASLQAQPAELENRQREFKAQIAAGERTSEAAQQALQKAESKQVELDRLAAAAITLLSEAREARGRAEERLTAADDRRLEIERRISDVLGVAPHLAIRQAGDEAHDALGTVADVEKRLERLKTERSRLGAVNLRADDEQREMADRFETLTSERNDIIEAIRMLRQAIQGLNKEGRERLLEAFDRVNEEFRRLFTHLFGGGDAELQLVESEDPLEAGLEILACPPGKRPQTMTLLSGGEQALTAMALIFAVFLTNPAPICVLDEVDAPLDDHNVERFCNLMDQMAASTETRFIVITHNPITMARMDRLFGVTMAEQGVSQLVSVDLQTAEQMVDVA